MHNHIIHQIWFDFNGENDIPAQFNDTIKSWKDKNDNWEYKLWDLSEAIQLISQNYPEYIETFNGFKYNISKCDLFRYILMHKYGGIYIDLDFICIRPIDQLLDLISKKSINTINKIDETPSVILTEEWPNSSKKGNEMIGESGTLHNGCILSEKNHPFWLSVIHEISKRSKEISGSESSVFDISGTKLLNDMYKKFHRQFNDVVALPFYYMSPLICQVNDTINIMCSPEIYKNLPNSSTWATLPENILKSSIPDIYPFSYSALLGFDSTWKS